MRVSYSEVLTSCRVLDLQHTGGLYQNMLKSSPVVILGPTVLGQRKRTNPQINCTSGEYVEAYKMSLHTKNQIPITNYKVKERWVDPFYVPL